MKLRALMLRKNLDDKRKALEAERAKDAEFEQREADLMASIEEASTDEEKAVVREAVDAFETEKAEHDKAVTDLDEEVRDLEAKLDEVERDQDAAAPAEPEAAPAEPEARSKRKESKAMNMRTRKVFGHMTREEREDMIQRADVQEFLTEVRRGISEKRAITNVGLLIPEVVLPVLRENIIEYSKLYKHVRVVAVSGEGRQPVMGTIPEAVWTDCCANLNELDLGFNDTEINCWKVGGYYAICNANIEDSDIDLLAEIVVALGVSIGLALDKAILYGKGTRMPLGVVTRLAQTSKPADYPETAREWADLHTSNMTKINGASMTDPNAGTPVAATTVTIVVVLTILSWQVGDLGWLLFNGSMFFTHTLCPILAIVLFTAFNPCEFKKTDARYAMIFTLGYAAVALVLNIAKIWHGPYPFLWVYEQPIWASVMWVVVILAGAFGLAKLLLLPNIKR